MYRVPTVYQTQDAYPHGVTSSQINEKGNYKTQLGSMIERVRTGCREAVSEGDQGRSPYPPPPAETGSEYLQSKTTLLERFPTSCVFLVIGRLKKNNDMNQYMNEGLKLDNNTCLLYTSPSPRD